MQERDAEHISELACRMAVAIRREPMFGCDTMDQALAVAARCLSDNLQFVHLFERYKITNDRLAEKPEFMLYRFRNLTGGKHRVVKKSPEEVEIVIDIMVGQSQRHCYYRSFWKHYKPTSALRDTPDENITDSAKELMLWKDVVAKAINDIAPEIIGNWSRE